MNRILSPCWLLPAAKLQWLATPGNLSTFNNEEGDELVGRRMDNEETDDDTEETKYSGMHTLGHLWSRSQTAT